MADGEAPWGGGKKVPPGLVCSLMAVSKPPLFPLATSVVLGGLGVLHVAWGRGSTFPFTSRDELNDAVIGSARPPSRGACYSIAALLAIGASSVASSALGASGLVRWAAGGVAMVLGSRGALGLAGRTDIVSRDSTSDRFRRLDRRAFSPLCLALAAGAARSLHRR